MAAESRCDQVESSAVVTGSAPTELRLAGRRREHIDRVLDATREIIDASTQLRLGGRRKRRVVRPRDVDAHLGASTEAAARGPQKVVAPPLMMPLPWPLQRNCGSRAAESRGSQFRT
jgi:hypothetical protein